MENTRWRRFLTIFLGLISLAAGTTKMLGVSVWVDTFLRFEFPAGWFIRAVAATEMAGGALFLLGRKEKFAASLLAVVWAGAALTHLRESEFQAALVPLILLISLILREKHR